MAESKRIFTFIGRDITLPFRSTQLFSKFVEGMEAEVKEGIKRNSYPRRSLYVDGSTIHSIFPDQLLSVHQDLEALNFEGDLADHRGECIMIVLTCGQVISIPVIGDLRRKNHAKDLHKMIEEYDELDHDPFVRILQDNTNYAVLNIEALHDQVLAVTTHSPFE